ncbi:hypothetical protein ACFP81_01785 [Deinococcus lacus]|uniref:Uncharacterized protein n=1 Tax=Deinococcus lacus TaxID=392561 RepID=A0ABW1Y9L3_9DEIO
MKPPPLTALSLLLLAALAALLVTSVLSGQPPSGTWLIGLLTLRLAVDGLRVRHGLIRRTAAQWALDGLLLGLLAWQAWT